MKTSSSRDTDATAFALADLIAIVCIVSLLALIVPLRAAIRPQSDRAICMNNQRQLAMAAITFASENDGVLPRAGNTLSVSCWVHGANMPDAAGTVGPAMLVGYSNQLAKVPQGQLWAYYQNLATLRCPSDVTNTGQTLSWFSQRSLKVASYGMNGYLLDSPSAAGSTALKLSQFAPDSIFFCEDDFTTPFAFNDASNFPTDLTIPTFAHDSAVVSSADGSAELIPLRTFTALKQAVTANRLFCYPKTPNGRP